jgi:hypothetical protein
MVRRSGKDIMHTLNSEREIMPTYKWKNPPTIEE